MKLLLATLLLTTFLTAQQPVPATRTLPISCADALSPSLAHSSRSVLWSSCPTSLAPPASSLMTSDLHDDAGHRVSASHASHLYIQPTRQKSSSIIWHAHSGIDTLARLTLTPEWRRLPHHPSLHLHLVRSAVPHRHPRQRRRRIPAQQSAPRKPLLRQARKDHAARALSPSLISRSALRPPKYPNSAM